MKIEERIKDILKQQQITVFGVADLRKHESDLVSFGGSIVKGFNME